MIQSARPARSIALTLRQEQSLHSAITQITPSDYWDWECRRAFASGLVPLTGDPVEQLRRRGVFPPGPGRICPSPVLTPMCQCQSRACTSRRKGTCDGGRVGWVYRHKHYPFYAIAGETPQPSDVDVAGVDAVTRRSVTIRLQARTRRDAFSQARGKGVEPTTVSVVRRGRRNRLCDDCRLALQEAESARDRARERQAAEASAADQMERDVRGREIVEEAGPESPTAAAVEAMRVYGVAPTETKLPPEDEASLRREVDRYLAAAGGTPKTVKVSFGRSGGERP